jgi:hypothetical protein
MQKTYKIDMLSINFILRLQNALSHVQYGTYNLQWTIFHLEKKS